MRARIYLAFVVLAGCGPSVPTFPIYGRDAGLECGDDDLGDCATGQVCLQGHCYASCSDTRPCGPREECSSGVCVAATERADAGMPDAAPPDPCDDVSCSDPTPSCRGGMCVACNGPGECVLASTPFCDVGRAQCVAFPGASVCGPCGVDGDCAGAGVEMRCLARTSPEPTERVCVPTCAGGAGCPQGFQCASEVCVPTLGASCTGYRAAVESRACTGDAECAPFAATASDGLFTGSCFDDGSGGATCHQPCGVETDCPAGQVCNGTFCL